MSNILTWNYSEISKKVLRKVAMSTSNHPVFCQVITLILILDYLHPMGMRY